QHAHVITRRAFDPAFASLQTAEDISAADHDDDLHAEFPDFADLLRHVLQRFGRNAGACVAAERFTAELEQNPTVLWPQFLFHDRENLKLEPVVGFEPTTDGLQNRCSTTELNWH